MIPAIYWPTTAAIIIAGGIAAQAFGLTPPGAIMVAAGLGMAAFIEIRQALKWRRGVLKGITAICSATAATGLHWPPPRLRRNGSPLPPSPPRGRPRRSSPPAA